MPAGRPHEATGNGGPRWMAVTWSSLQVQNPAYRPTRLNRCPSSRSGSGVSAGQGGRCVSMLVQLLASGAGSVRRTSEHRLDCCAGVLVGDPTSQAVTKLLALAPKVGGAPRPWARQPTELSNHARPAHRVLAGPVRRVCHGQSPRRHPHRRRRPRHGLDGLPVRAPQTPSACQPCQLCALAYRCTRTGPISRRRCS